MFTKRPSPHPVFHSEGEIPHSTDVSSQRVYTPGEQVLLLPKAKGPLVYLNAEVLGTNGDRLRVRALHSFHRYSKAKHAAHGLTEIAIADRAEFEVGRDAVFVVTLLGH